MTTPTLTLADMRQTLLEAERRELLDDRIMALLQLDDDRKRRLGFPEVILDELLVPLSIISNKLQVAAFKGMDTAERTRWIKAHLAAVGCALVPGEEYHCRAELVRIEG